MDASSKNFGDQRDSSILPPLANAPFLQFVDIWFILDPGYPFATGAAVWWEVWVGGIFRRPVAVDFCIESPDGRVMYGWVCNMCLGEVHPSVGSQRRGDWEGAERWNFKR